MKQMYGDPMEFNATNHNKPNPKKNKKRQEKSSSKNPAQGKKYYGCGKKGYF